MNPQTISSSETDSTSLYAQLDQYPWSSDAEFQGGLGAILGSNTSADSASELTLRARCFYYSRKFDTDVDFDGYKAWREGNGRASASASASASNATAGSNPPVNAEREEAQPGQRARHRDASNHSAEEPDDAPYPSSFQHIVELITTGKPIPGIKEIPDTVLSGQGSASTRQRRKKPWEKGCGGEGTATT